MLAVSISTRRWRAGPNDSGSLSATRVVLHARVAQPQVNLAVVERTFFAPAGNVCSTEIEKEKAMNRRAHLCTALVLLALALASGASAG